MQNNEADKDEIIRLKDEAISEIADRPRERDEEIERLQALLTKNNINFQGD